MDTPNTNDVQFEDEDDEELNMPVEASVEEQEAGFNWRLCLIGRFIQIGSLDFSAMQ